MRHPRLISPSTHSLFAALHPVRVALCATIFFGVLCAEAQFQLQDSNTTASLRGVSSPGNGVAWASGTGGTVLRTEDGGYVWQGCAMPPGAEKLDFRGVQAFDAQTALVMSSGKGDLSRVYKTTDGCRTWKLVFTNPDADGFFDALAMRPPVQKSLQDYGVLVGDPVNGVFAIFFTLNQGNTWERMKGVPRAHQGEALFAASNQSLSWFDFPGSFALITGGTAGARLLKFTQCGEENWKVCAARYRLTDGQRLTPLDLEDWTRGWTSHTLDFPRTPSAGAFAIAQKASGSGFPFVVVGGDYAKADVSDQTATYFKFGQATGGEVTQPWHASKKMPHGYRSSVAYDIVAKTWITVGPNGTDISRDDGRNWSPLLPGKDDAPDADKQWNALALPFVVGPHGRIGRLRDDALKPYATSKPVR